VATQGGVMGGSHVGPSPMPRVGSRLFALLVAFIVLVSGFGALNVVSVIMIHSPKLRGLYSYRSATLGDGLLLPVWAYGLARAAAVRERWPGRSILVIVGVALAGGVAGVATQIAWLRSATTAPNWTIPAPHTFNFAGWYHAAFLSVASGMFAAFGAASWLRVRHEPSAQALARLRGPGAFLLTLDNVPTGQDPWRASTFVLPVVTLVILYVLLVSATHGRGIKVSAELTVASVLPVAAFTAVFWPGSVFRGLTVLLALAALLGGVAISPPSKLSRVEERAAAAVLIGACLAGPVMVAASRRPEASFAPMLVALAVGVALASAERFALIGLTNVPAASRSGDPGVLAVGSVLALACSGAYLSAGGKYGGWIALVGPLLTVTIVAPWIYRRFDLVIEAERRGVDADELSRAKKDAYQAIGGITGMALLSLLSLSIGTAPTRHWRNGSWNPLLVVMIGVAAAVLVTVILVMLLASKRPSRQVAVCVICLAVWTVCQWVLFALAQPSGIVGVPVSVFVALIVGLFVAEGIRGNMSSLHNLPLDGPVKVVAVLSGLAAGSTVLWLLDMTAMVRGKPSSLFAAITAMTISVSAIQILPYLAARSLHRQPSRQFVPATPLAGVLQDSFVSLLLGIFVVWLPLAILAHIGDVQSWAQVDLPYVAYLSAAYVWIMRNNVEHVDRAFARARQEAGSGQIPREQRKALEGLRAHCQRQNRLALGTLVPLVVVAVFSLASELGGFKPTRGMFGFVRTLLIR
jgi:hypothetical protein